MRFTPSSAGLTSIEHFASGDFVAARLSGVGNFECVDQKICDTLGGLHFAIGAVPFTGNPRRIHDQTDNESHQAQRDCRGSRHAEAVAQYEFAHMIRERGPHRQNRLVAKVTLEIGGKIRRRAVAPAAFFLESFERNRI